MSFKADPPSIRDFGSAIGELADDADQARRYAEQWLGIGYSEGRIFATVVEQATAVREALVENYQKLQTLVETSREELTRAADHYDQTDFSVLERMDSTYPAPDPSGAD